MLSSVSFNLTIWIVIWNSNELNTFSGRKDNPDIKAYISPRLLSGLVNFIQYFLFYCQYQYRWYTPTVDVKDLFLKIVLHEISVMLKPI